MTTPKLAVDVKQLAKNAYNMRVQNGLTIKNMATATQLSYGTVKRIEKAKTNEGARSYIPSYGTLFKLARAARVSIETFTTMQLNYK